MILTVKQIRVRNINLLAKKFSRKEIAAQLGYPDTTYINQLCGGHGSFGNATARKIEKTLDLETGWMDVIHTSISSSKSISKFTPKNKEMVNFAEVLEELNEEQLLALLDVARSFAARNRSGS